MIFNAFRDRKYGNGALCSRNPPPLPVSKAPASDPTGAPSDALPGIGSVFCKTSYAASVKPNCGLERRMRAGPPLKKARKPSSW